MIFSAKCCRFHESTFGISRRIGVLISFLMANSASFELRESSAAASSSVLFLKRSSNVRTDRPGAGVDQSLPLYMEVATSRCLLQLIGANPEWRHPAQMFFSVNAFGLALM